MPENPLNRPSESLSDIQDANQDKNPLRIAVIMPLAEQRGGGELMFWQLMEYGRHSSIEWVAVFLQDGPMVQAVRDLGVTVEVVEAGRMREGLRFLKAVQRIAEIIRQHRIDFVLGWMGTGHLYGGLAALKAGVPAMWYQLGIPAPPDKLDRIAVCIPAFGVLACSEAGAKAQRDLAPKIPVRVVYPGVELDRFIGGNLESPTVLRRKLGLPLSGPLIGIVGRLQRWKGMHVLAEAMPEILKTRPDAHCVIVGGEHAFEPDYPAFLNSRIQELGVAEHITLTGLQKNIPEWMQAMDIVVHASDREPFGIVIIEGMALGKPVIAGDAAGPTEIITHGINGLLSPYGDAPSLARNVLRLLAEPEFASKLGNAAAERAPFFSVQQYSRNIMSALRELYSARKRKL